MDEKCICITEHDLKRLRELITAARTSVKGNGAYLQELEQELNRAKVFKPQAIPSNVITMNSEVHLKDLDTEEEETYRIVFPQQADVDKGWVSILAPVGTALLGYSVGDTVEWNVPSGVAKWKVMKILYQPEAAGDFDR